jgi:2',3'-cyclic-nucleotide 2'-phosphodiesterase (5'-nucleotidase family)
MKINGIALSVVFTITGLILLCLACNAPLESSPPASSSLADNYTELTIMHTNDTHAALDNIGRRATLIKQIREEAGEENTLLVDSGDVFNGTLYFTVAQGLADVWFMQYLSYDAMSLGNHEFDKGPAVLANFIDNAEFPILCANFDFSQEKHLAGKIQPWTIIQKGGEKYGLIGLTLETTREISSPGANITINDVFQSAQQAVTALKDQQVDKIIALTHIGWDNDIDLAKKVKGIDIIIGGYSHIVPEVYPTVVIKNNVPTLIVQAGTQGQYLGMLKVAFDQNGILKNWDGSRLIAINKEIEPDPVCTTRLAEYQKPINELMTNIIGSTMVNLDGDKKSVRSQESNLGNLITDAMLKKAGSAGADLAIINGGTIRSSIPTGDISLGQVLEVLPFGNYLMVIELSGKQIMAALENGVSQVEQTAGRFPHVAGIRYTWAPGSPPGSRIALVEIKTPAGYKPIDLSVIYTVATYDFLYMGGDGYTVFHEAKRYKNLGFTDYEVLQEYVTDNSPLNIGIEGRIKHLGK